MQATITYKLEASWATPPAALVRTQYHPVTPCPSIASITQLNEGSYSHLDIHHHATLPDSQTVDHNGDSHTQTSDTQPTAASTDRNTWRRCLMHPDSNTSDGLDVEGSATQQADWQLGTTQSPTHS